MALYLLPILKITTGHVARASNNPAKSRYATSNDLVTPNSGKANSAVLLAEPALTIWDRIQGVMRWT